MNTGQQVIIHASAHEIPLPSGVFHTVCTSPPYYSLRRYEGAQDIAWPEMEYSPMPGLPPLTIEAMSYPLGLEPTPEAFIGHLILCFREVRRVMREDGVCWTILGDSFASTAQGTYDHPQAKGSRTVPDVWANYRPKVALDGGNLMMIPHRFALAAQADGWTIRNDVVWAKKCAMPESVSGWRWERCKVKVGSTPYRTDGKGGQFRQGSRDRDGTDGHTHVETTWTPCPGCAKCEATGGYVLRRGSWRHTRAHEYVFMMTRKMGYFADQERVREDLAESSIQRLDQPTFHEQTGGQKDYGSGSNRSARKMLENLEQSRNGRNPRSVLTPTPENYKGAHYAVYPRSLIAPLLRATAPTRVCPECGAAWAPIVDREKTTIPVDERHGRTGHNDQPPQQSGWFWKEPKSQLLGHRPTCACPAHDPVPGWCLDPFAGTFTTGEVCAELGVNAVGLDISPRYLDEHAKPRIGLTPSNALDDLPMFAGVTP